MVFPLSLNESSIWEAVASLVIELILFLILKILTTKKLAIEKQRITVLDVFKLTLLLTQ